MRRHVLQGEPPIEVQLRRSSAARRLSLRVSRMDGRVTLTLPRHAREAQGLAFLDERRDWLRDQLARLSPALVPAPGLRFPLEGTELILATGPGRTPHVAGGQLIVPGDPARLPGRLQGWLKARARDRLAAASDRHAEALGLPYSRLTLRDTRSRWGSCSSAGALMYSWRLVMAPPAVLDYVAAHEVAHLAQMNHGPAFWEEVSRLCPDWARHRTWLTAHGETLMRWRFAAD